MSGEVRSRWLVAAAALATAQFVVLPAEAQFFWDRQSQWGDQQNQYRRSRPQSGGFFQNWFGPRSHEDEYAPRPPRQQQHVQQPTESSRAPAPRKSDSKTTPTISIVVLGDEMSDWLAYGLEEVFADSPEIGILRKSKLYSGLLRYDSKGDLDWWHVARDTLAQEKTDYVVMMLGLGDRQDLREKDLAKEAETRAKDQQAKDEAEKKTGQKTAKPDDAQEAGARTQPGKKIGNAEFRGDEWAKIYSRRIDDTIAALKSKGVPVIWVGLPPIRGARSTSDVAYLNDLYRARAERAGITYIDVWDGFVDESGKYSNYGPDYEGQVRRLRLSDGVFFTKYGAIKLARYVEHELSRHMSNRTPVALPAGPEPAPSAAKPAERPLTGPVVPLTGGAPSAKDSDELMGGPGSSPIHGDATAVKVLAKGETVSSPAERADNFAWPNGSAARQTPASAPPETPVAQTDAQPNMHGDAEHALAAAPSDAKQQERKKGSAGKLTQHKPLKKRASTESPGSRWQQDGSRWSQDDAPRPPRSIGQSGGFFGSWR